MDMMGLLAFLKFVVFVFDSNPQVFLGDSMSYLATVRAVESGGASPMCGRSQRRDESIRIVTS
jgi:hypothetical protein